MKVLKRIPLNIIIRYVVLLLVVFIIAKLTTGEEYNDSINEAPINATISSKDTGTTTVGTTKVILGDNNDEMVVSTLKSGETVTYTLRKNDKDDIMSNAISSKGTTEQSTKKTSETTTKQSSHITAPQVASSATKKTSATEISQKDLKIPPES